MTKKKTGRKPKWEDLDIPSKLDAITGWCKQGSTDKEIAAMLGISTKLFYEWKLKYREFREAIKRGKDIANGELLNAAFKSSIGFYYKEQIPIKVRTNEAVPTADGKGIKYIPSEKVELVEIEKFALPDHTMNIFMLKNRMPEQYKDKREVALDDANLTITVVPAPRPEENTGENQEENDGSSKPG